MRLCRFQRIYIYKEYKAKSPRLHSADIYPRKQETVRKTTPELLLAVLRSFLCRVCVYCTLLVLHSILCTLLYSRVGRFCTFLNFMQSHVVCCSPRGTTIFLFWFKVHIFKIKSKGENIKIDFLEKCFLYSIAYIIVEKIKSCIKNLVDTFLFSKKGTFPKKSIAQLS